MASHLEQPGEISDPDWIEFEGLLSEMARIAKSGLPFDRLARSLLERTVHILAAVGGAVWLGARSAPMRMQCQLDYDELASTSGDSDHQQLLEHAREIGEMVVIPPGGEMIGARTVTNPTDLTLLIAPLKVDQDVVGLFEILQRPSTSAAAIQGNRRLLGLVCELAADHLRLQELRQLRDAELRTEQFEDLLARVHGSLDLRAVAYELVNSGRQFIGCDRVSVAIRKGKRFELIAISAIDTINRRSNAVRRLEELAARVAAANETVWYDGEGEKALAPQILEPLQRFADDAHPRIVGLVPLTVQLQSNSEALLPPLGVLIVEQFDSELDPLARARAARAATHGAAALANALQYESLPTLPLARRRSRPLGRPDVRMATKLAVLAAAILVAALFLLPADFNVHAEGELQPQQQQHLFAPMDGQVSSLHVQHGDDVSAKDVLLELRSPDVELQRQRIQGEFDTTQQRISAIESSLLQADDADDADISHFNQLAAEQEELTQLLASQREQLALLREQREKLVIASPMDGQVLTWDLEQSLTDRPVQRGQLLLTVANLKGPWMAELSVPDDEIGHVLAAQSEAAPLSAKFQLATNRGVDYEGEIIRVASRTETSEDDRPVVRVTMDVDEKAIGDLRPGATIFADIHCGTRSLAYVLFHDLVETVQGWLNF
jgi:multidrug efflux pump subunit AcrA (membrane-fusion protein)